MLYENELFKIENVGANLNIIPKKDLFQMNETELGKVGLASTISSALLFEITKVEGTNIILNENKILVIGRKNSDNANIGWTPKIGNDAELSEMQKKISDALKPVEEIKPLPISNKVESVSDEVKDIPVKEPDNLEEKEPDKVENTEKDSEDKSINYMIHHLKRNP